MYAIQNPPLELLMLNEHKIISMKEIKNPDFENLYEIQKVDESILLDYEVVCYTCNKFLNIYDPVASTLRKPTKKENQDFIIKK